MNEAYGNLWDFQADATCITTNGFVKANGRAVMGRGCAKEAAEMFPLLPLYLGQKISRDGNNVAFVKDTMLRGLIPPSNTDGLKLYPPLTPLSAQALVFYPVKHHWKQQADVKLIERSAHQLVELTDRQGWQSVYLPRPGCGNGRLSWDYVRPIIEPILDHRFTVVTGFYSER